MTLDGSRNPTISGVGRYELASSRMTIYPLDLKAVHKRDTYNRERRLNC